jgi:hypothetical protein
LENKDNSESPAPTPAPKVSRYSAGGKRFSVNSRHSLDQKDNLMNRRNSDHLNKSAVSVGKSNGEWKTVAKQTFQFEQL